MTVVYPNMTIDHFSLFSFFFSLFFACVLSTKESAAGVPQSCTVMVTGLGKNGN